MYLLNLQHLQFMNKPLFLLSYSFQRAVQDHSWSQVLKNINTCVTVNDRFLIVKNAHYIFYL